MTLLLALAIQPGCKFETGVIPSTQVVVDVDADESVRGRTEELRISISAAPHHDRLDERSTVFKRTYRRGSGGDVEVPLFPVRMVLAPRRGDPRRVFEIVASSHGADGNELTRARVMSGYVEHEVRHVRVQLNARCVGVVCGDFDSCRSGVCEAAWREPRDLPLLGSRADRGRPSEPEIDAAMVDSEAPEPDAAVEDAATDGGAPPRRCEADHGGCDPLVTCADDDGVVRCGQCPSGFWDQHGDGTSCTDIDECQSDNGGCDPAHASCMNLPGGHECRCETGYFGNGRECTRNVPCVEDPAVCDALASCIDWGGKRLCVCGPGYEGDGARCSDIDECARGAGRCMANSHCVNNEGSFSCACDSGYVYKQGTCVDVDECAAGSDDCDDMPEACVNEAGGFRCVCPAGYNGSGIGGQGCADVDECQLGTHTCPAGASCMNTVGSFRCTCKPGYLGDGMTCTDVDECQLATDNCAAGADCVNKPGTFSCACKPGYTGDGVTCTDIDECAQATSNNCTGNARCVNNEGNFSCKCKPGYDGDGKTCTDVDECKGKHDCSSNATCTNTAGSFGCTCKAGFSGDGRTCTEMPPG